MLKKLLLMAVICLWAGGMSELQARSLQNPNPQEVLELIDKVNTHWQTTHPKHGRAFWDNAAYHTGNMEAFFLTRKIEYLAYSIAWAEQNEWKGAKSNDRANWKYATYGERENFVMFGDWQICFQTYADIYMLDRDPKKIARAREVMEYQMQTDSVDYWWWADGLYMVMPVMTKLYRITQNPLYLEKLHQYWTYACSIMYDEETGLFFRDGKYVYPKHKSANGKKDFWARGDGWVLAALAKVLKDLPADDAHRDEYIAYYKKMARAVADCQQPEGYWTRSMLDPDHAPGPETSGTAFFTYGLLWGINNGYLSEREYRPVVLKAWRYLTETAVQDDGRLGYVQPIGEKAIPGQIVNANSTANFGVGAFLLAACEMYRYVTSDYAHNLQYIGKGYSSTSVNTPIFRNNAVVTHNGKQYVAYYDAQGYVTLASRLLGHAQWNVQRSAYKGKVTDAHNTISLMVDGDGYLHLAFDHHGNNLRYCRSVAAGSLTLGDLEPMTGRDEADVTYPEFYRLAGGDLLFAYRSGASGRGNLVLNRYDLQSRTWQRVQDVLIDGENQRNAYWQLCVDAKGVIHVSWVWRETWMVETNHDLCYARSADGGKTWTHADGTQYDLPIRAGNAEYACRIPQNSELINQTSMSADAKGHPYIATYWRSADSDIPQYRVVWHDGKQWHEQQVSQRTTPFTLKGGGTKMIPIARPRMVVDGKKAYYFFRDEERGSRVSMYYTRNLKSGKWEVTDLTDFAVHAWEPSLDTELWKNERQLHLFVQDTYQGDGEKTVKSAATPVYVLEVK